MEEKIIDIIELVMEHEGASLESKLIEDLGMNSMAFVRMIVLIEKEFGILFADEAFVDGALPDVKSVLNYVINASSNQ